MIGENTGAGWAVVGMLSMIGAGAGAVTGNDGLLGLAASVGGLGGLLSVLIYVTGRKDAAEARRAYEALVVLMVERMDNMIAAQGRIMDQQRECLEGVRDAVVEVQTHLEMMDRISQIMEVRDAGFRVIRPGGVGAGGATVGGAQGSDEG